MLAASSAMAAQDSVPPAPAILAAAVRLPATVPAGDTVPSLADAAPIAGFVQVAPMAGSAPSRRTELRMAHDGKALHIQVHAYDPEPAAIVAQQMRRDVEGMLTEDQVTLVFDPDGDGRNGYLFAVNANGAQFDALIFDGGQMRFDWDALWRSEARVEADGWHADITIPLSVFGRGRPIGGDEVRTWRINAERWMPRGSERVRLAGIQPDKEVYSLGDALPMPAIAADHDGWGLRLKTSLRATSESAAASGTGRARQRLEPGLEVFHESPSGLRTTAALNIDFGEAEADERTVNLTRFELFRPEKREFFLQDAGRFTFGGLVESAVIPYYSRRVGLDATGRGRSLDAGLKFSGQLAGTDFGLFGARVAGGQPSLASPISAPPTWRCCVSRARWAAAVASG
ncbi:MAG: carbohydrate binding family 9 domain-containing protein [Zoogloea sp.]|nr:carbohydrate binding family 9 domain-containing protein [Zoogloea sp.]